MKVNWHFWDIVRSNRWPYVIFRYFLSKIVLVKTNFSISHAGIGLRWQIFTDNIGARENFTSKFRFQSVQRKKKKSNS